MRLLIIYIAYYAVAVLCFCPIQSIRSFARHRLSLRSATSSESILVELHPGKAAFLVGKWKTSVENDISLGFLPKHTHPNRNVSRLMRSSKYFKDVYAMCSALAMSDKDTANTNVLGTPRSQHGAAIALVDDSTDFVDILHLVINPDARDDIVIRAAEVEILDAIRERERARCQNAPKIVRISSAARLNLLSSDTELDISADSLSSTKKDEDSTSVTSPWLTFNNISPRSC
uniref:Uncharacterized protein n=1 Tax=Aureoumbra lagunensis TaxID=44058 RepID=A0A7S3JXS9_9STRA|mmetsp:Transcript_7509/g.11233  ORF Transcript_7509/g.11233 Transcript_7509/m.11233 type:complete len:231 (-) Transcript_7509:103-795(-)